MDFSTGNISVAFDEQQLKLAMDTLAAIPGGAQKAMRSAINDTLRYGRTQLTRKMQDYLNLKQADIRDHIKITHKPTDHDLEGVISIDHKTVPLFDFHAKYGNAGVTVQQFKGGAVEHFKHMFDATMDSGHEGIFERVFGANKVNPRSGSYAGRVIKRGPKKGQLLQRQPIKEAFGISVLGAFEKNENLADEALKDIGDKLHERLLSKIQWQLAMASSAEPPDTE